MLIPLFKKFRYLFCLFFFCVHSFLIGAENQQEDKTPYVLVSVAPYKLFVEKIAQGTVHVFLMVPAGASAHTFEPTSRQILTASRGEIWFRTGEPFEERAIKALKSHQPQLEIVDLRQGVDLIHCSEHSCKGCCLGGDDLHFWLSARQMHIQAQTIADALIRTYPEHASLYRSNLKLLQKELHELDEEIEKILEPLKNRNILVSHPAYAYFCRDYQLNQYSIEMEGKDPTPQQMTKLLNTMRQLHLNTIYIQQQYNNKAAKLVAETMGAKLVTLDPYAENYFDTMREIAHAFSKG